MPTPRRPWWAFLLAFALTLSGLSAVVGGGFVVTGAARSISLDSTSESSVGFALHALPSGTLSVGLAFSAIISSTGGPILPGQTVEAATSVSAPPTIQLDLGFGGSSTSIPVAPLGSLVDVPLPGLNYSYLGASLGFYLNLTGEILGQSSVQGPGSGGGGALAWNNSTDRSFSVTANASAPSGSSLTLSLSGIQYAVSMGIDAGGDVPFVGYRVVHILNFGSLGLVPGSPSSVNSTYELPAADAAGAASSGLDNVGLADLLFLSGGIVAVIAAAVLARRALRRP
jgi:hypothetical protein